MDTLKSLMAEYGKDHTIEDNKDKFAKGVMVNLVLRGLGIDEYERVETANGHMIVSKKAYDIVVDYINGKRVKPILLAYLVCGKYAIVLKELLQNSYNYYRTNSLPKWKESFVYEHIFILEDGRFNSNRVYAPGFKYVSEDEFMEEKMKFDLVIGNPAFNGGLDLKIHKVMEGHSDKIVFVHPAGYALSHKDGVTKSACKDIDMTKMESLHLFWGNELFNIGLFVPVCVSVWKKDKKGSKVKVIDDAFTKTTYDCDCNEVHLHGKKYTKLVKWLKENVDFTDNVAKHGGRKVKDKYGFVMSAVRGHPSFKDDGVLNDDFFTILPEEVRAINNAFKNLGFDLDEKEKNRSEQRVFSFAIAAHRENFIKYLKSKCVRFILSLSKTSQNLFTGELNQIPWMDFSKDWSDEMLRKEWNIDDNLWEYINKFIPDFYSDYHYDGIY